MRVSLALLVCALLTTPALAAPGDGPYDIMKPERQGYFEPWLAPKYKTPRGMQKPAGRNVKVPRSETLPRTHVVTPPPMVVPQTGRVLPNLPVTQGSGPGGSESFHDRAIRCTQQSGLYGPAAGDPGIYTRSCINQ